MLRRTEIIGESPFKFQEETPSPKEELEPERIKVLVFLESHNAVRFDGDNLVVDVNEMRVLSEGWRKIYENTSKGKKVNRLQFLETLRGLKAYTEEDVNSEDYREGNLEQRSIMKLPESLEDLSLNSAGYGDSSIFKPWELQERVDWGNPIELESGEKTNLAEIYIATQLKRLGVYRDAKGYLKINNSNTGQKETFSIEKFANIISHIPRVQGTLLDIQPLLFVQQYTPNLLKLGIFKESDFRRIAGSETSRIFNVHERKLTPQMPYVSFTNEFGNSVKYYIGRQSICGTGHKIDHQNTRVRLLDGQTAGIVETVHGKKRVIFTFSLLDKIEGEELRRQIAESLRKKGKPVEKKNISANAAVGAEEMKKRIKEYKITDYIRRHSGESEVDYAERVAKLSDINFVIGTFHKIFEKAKIGMHNLPWKEQLVLANAVLEEKNKDRLVKFARSYGLPGIRVLLSVDYERGLGKKILNIGKNLDTELAKRIFLAYDSATTKMLAVSKDVCERLRMNFPSLDITEEVIAQSLMARAKDFVSELVEVLKKSENKERVVDEFCKEIESELPEESTVRANFKAIVVLLEREEVSLRSLQQEQELVLGKLMSGENKALIYRVLARMGKLEPVPEIHWKVDRTSAEYSRRFGINLNDLLKERASRHLGSQNLLEIGPGSGVAKKERAMAGLDLRYNDFALSDKIYYSLAGVIEKLVDFKKLEVEVGVELTEEERKAFADYIYKTIVIKQGQTGKDDFEYDAEFQAQIAEDVNAIKSILPKLGERLKEAEAVPSSISSRNEQGKVFYPNKIEVQKQSQAFQKAKTAFESNPEQFLTQGYQERDLNEDIEAFPANVMIGDMGEIRRLKSAQIDVEIASRSTLYKYGDEYVKFLGELERVLVKGGQHQRQRWLVL